MSPLVTENTPRTTETIEGESLSNLNTPPIENRISFTPERTSLFSREYHGEDAKEIVEELRKLVNKKGDDFSWEDKEGRPSVNIIVVRGLDFQNGICSESNRYNDTMYIARRINDGSFKVLEVRSASESGAPKDENEDRRFGGTARLDSSVQQRFIYETHAGDTGAAQPEAEGARSTVERFRSNGDYETGHTGTFTNIHWHRYPASEFSESTPVDRSSVGCITVPCNLNEFNRYVSPFLNLGAGGRENLGRGTYSYPLTIIERGQLEQISPQSNLISSIPRSGYPEPEAELDLKLPKNKKLP